MKLELYLILPVYKKYFICIKHLRINIQNKKENLGRIANHGGGEDFLRPPRGHNELTKLRLKYR